ncbi:hypothetical protein JCM11641_004074 [Rhodosporidiobolus odoratus]
MMSPLPRLRLCFFLFFHISATSPLLPYDTVKRMILLRVIGMLVISLVVARPFFHIQPAQLARRQSPADLCNASDIQPPIKVIGLPDVSGRQIVAVALGRGTQNYTCTFSQQAESGALAVLTDVTCLAAYLSHMSGNGTNSTTSSPVSISNSATTSATSPSASSTDASTATSTGGGGSDASDAVASTSTPATFLIPLDDPSLADPDTLPSISELSSLNFSSLPALALSVPFPFNATTFPFLPNSSYFGEHYYAPFGDMGEILPLFSLPGYGNVTAREVNRSTEAGGSGGNVTWAAFEAVDGGEVVFASVVWRTDTIGGGISKQNCSSEGNQTAVDFAALYYFFG